MNFNLTEEQQLIVDTVRQFCENELYPHEGIVEKTGKVPTAIAQDIVKKTQDMGFFAANFPESVGGGGLSQLEFTLLERELGRASQALSIFFGRPSGILMACEGDQREQYLYPAVKGDKFDALAMTEPNAGSDVRGMQCAAKADGDDWVVNGTKHFISHADVADFVIVFIATGEEQTSRGMKKLITCFLVDKGTPGFEILPGYESISHRGYHNCILSFDNCRLNKRQILGEVHRGFDIANDWLGTTRLTVAAMCVGRAQRCLELTIPYCTERVQFGQAIGKFQGVSFKLADMVTNIDAANLLTLNAAARIDDDLPFNREVSIAKLFATEMLAKVTDEAIQIHGGMGLMDDLPFARFWRDSRVERIWDGTSEIQRHIISRDLLRPYE